MQILAISGSARTASTNTALLRAMQAVAPPGMHITVFAGVADLPVFSPDREGPHTPAAVRTLMEQIAAADGLLISSPEYVRGIPGGLKNAIDWLVSGEHIVHKPIALVHASHRGDDMLDALRLVLSTISSQFNSDLFLRIPVMKQLPDAIHQTVAQHPDVRGTAIDFLQRFAEFCRPSQQG